MHIFHHDQVFISLRFCVLVFKWLSCQCHSVLSEAESFMAGPVQENEHACKCWACTWLHLSVYVFPLKPDFCWNKVPEMLRLQTYFTLAFPHQVRSTSRCSSGNRLVNYAVTAATFWMTLVSPQTFPDGLLFLIHMAFYKLSF